MDVILLDTNIVSFILKGDSRTSVEMIEGKTAVFSLSSPYKKTSEVFETPEV